MKKINSRYIFVGIVLLAFFLRIYKLGEIPISLNPDEAALGYTSYAFLKTAADEHGQFLPLALQSFGDWKLPVYSYVGVIPVGIFGLTEFATRFPSMAAGVIGVIFIYYISLSLFKKQGVALFSAFFFAISPWSIYFSRAAYEVNLATTIFLGGLLCFLTYINNGQKNKLLVILSFFLFALTIFTQHPFIVFSPLFTLSLVFIYRKNIIWDKAFLAGVGLFLSFFAISIASNFFGGYQKVSNLVIFNDTDILYQRVEKLRGDNAEKIDFVETLIHTKYIGVPYHIAQNYVKTFSPEFLFDKGGEKLVHNLGGFGNLYLFDALLLTIGFAYLFRNREKSLRLLLLWIILAPIPSIVTKDTPNSTRLFQLMPFFVLVTGYGAYYIVQLLRVNVIRQMILGIFTLFFALNISLFLEEYFVHFDTQRARFWKYGYREAVMLSQQYPDYTIVMRGPENFPYIYFLFYNRYDPTKFKNEVAYYPPTDEGFLFVKSFGRYSFVNRIDYSRLEAKTIYIDDREVQTAPDRKIMLPSGEAILKYEIVK